MTAHKDLFLLDSRRGLWRRLAAGTALALALVGTMARCAAEDSDGSGREGDGDGGGGPDGATPDAVTPDAVTPDGGIDGALRAFPGAEGFGTDTPGGRGGRVIPVTTLAWDGPGSFSEAMLATEPRIIVFRVSGVIEVPETGLELGEAHSYVTVAGQTSPGGITFTGSSGTFLSAYQSGFHDAIFRFLRFRGRGNYDNISFNTVHHIVIDHCDFSGGSDETFDITNAHDVTVQWSTVTNSDAGGQNYGSLIAYNPTAGFSIHHNFYAHHANRCAPHMHWADGVPATGSTIEFSNNVVYNCAFDAIMYLNTPDEGAERISFNLVGNYFRPGPNTPEEAYSFALPDGSHVYEDGTVYESRSVWPGWGGPELAATRADAPSLTTQSAESALEIVLARAGAFPRDPMNTRTVDEARTGTGGLGRLDDALITVGPEPPADADLDGMADEWELGMGLDPEDGSDAGGDLDGDGYTNVEEYIGALADALVPE